MLKLISMVLKVFIEKQTIKEKNEKKRENIKTKTF
jgi:hypothetical protein